MPNSQAELQEKVLELLNEITAATLDKITTHYTRNRVAQVEMRFDGKNYRTMLPFYSLSISTAFSIIHDKQIIFSYDGGIDGKFEVKKHVPQLQDSVVSRILFDTETFKLSVGFTNNYQLNVNYINENNHEYRIGRNFVPNPRGARWIKYIIKGNEIGLSVGMS